MRRDKYLREHGWEHIESDSRILNPVPTLFSLEGAWDYQMALEGKPLKWRPIPIEDQARELRKQGWRSRSFWLGNRFFTKWNPPFAESFDSVEEAYIEMLRRAEK